ncbi:MAG TPA: hypothetical protein VHR18_02585 [Solirubrobacterales bacterium]|jgi:hypothetical protein|nr:hypothetical protein [Solirubrobacterales bacterium]
MTDARRSSRRPGPGAVLWGSVALFAVLFALLTFQLSSASEPSTSGATAAAPVQVRKVIKRRIVTTIVPSPGATSVSSGPVTSSEQAPEEALAEPVTTGAS